ncbi:hypothetical protein JX265_005403 [Neoarthrinium moseri]|uniref:SWIM-type domain-containing protein n=1 Tax=Neoarthrinium moseri TaxID=1658444 RepID=A0A9Q0ARS3_9PEZI|nr:uncharacterized protein JN550_009376 [Neoarthrinium moseri]KAI1845248.1 hypothetical protein JX266_008558 [Neoarthrinium moseri]KAI1863878.1 hypothetical protein JN550_009376 [Neoarthrinium moseri]KAI1872523.1 hypothetical protein JX265_005403 [Neoarthrinium moseri]
MPPPPSPTERFSQLSIEGMPPITRQQSRNRQEDLSSESEADTSGDASNSDATESPFVFPSGLAYNLENLNENIQGQVTAAMDEPPQLVLQDCQARDDTFIFQISEVIEHNIRTGSVSSGWAIPSCSCQDEQPFRRICRHVLWLFDQITKEIFDNRGQALTMNEHGFSEELGERGNPFEMISEFHLDILADSLHSRMLRAGSPTDEDILNPRRVQDVREILASLNSTPVDEYRRDIFDNPRLGKRVIKRNDLESTVFRMLCRNNEFFHYFLSSMRSDELVNNTFRRLQQRADVALAGLDAYAQTSAQSTVGNPKNVAWCATHLRLIVQKVHTSLEYAQREPKPWERHTAACTLVHVLRCVVDRSSDLPPQELPKRERNLYFRLVGNRDENFVIGVLNSIPPSSVHPLAGALEQILEDIGRLGAPVTYVEKLRALHQRARRAHPAASPTGSKRQGGGQERRAKRMK